MPSQSGHVICWALNYIPTINFIALYESLFVKYDSNTLLKVYIHDYDKTEYVVKTVHSYQHA